jgi:hypothetical protein
MSLVHDQRHSVSARRKDARRDAKGRRREGRREKRKAKGGESALWPFTEPRKARIDGFATAEKRIQPKPMARVCEALDICAYSEIRGRDNKNGSDALAA